VPLACHMRGILCLLEFLGEQRHAQINAPIFMGGSVKSVHVEWKTPREKARSRWTADLENYGRKMRVNQEVVMASVTRRHVQRQSSYRNGDSR
jgi:hypothetical protein